LIESSEVTLSQISMDLKKIKLKFKVKHYGCKTLGAVYEKPDRYDVVRTSVRQVL
jgi:hypothetical protein